MKKDDFGENLTILQADITKEEEVQRSIKWLDENTDEINIVFYSIGIIGSNSLVGTSEFSINCASSFINRVNDVIAFQMENTQNGKKC